MGQIALVAPVTIPLNEIAALAVTDEPAGGSPQPTTPIAWIVKLNNYLPAFSHVFLCPLC